MIVMTKILSVRVTSALNDALRAEAARLRLRPADLMRIFIAQALDTERPDAKAARQQIEGG